MTAMLTDDYTREYDHAIHLLYGSKVKHTFATINEAYNFAQKL